MNLHIEDRKMETEVKINRAELSAPKWMFIILVFVGESGSGKSEHWGFPSINNCRKCQEDYKTFGEPKRVEVWCDKSSGSGKYYFDKNGNGEDMKEVFPRS